MTFPLEFDLLMIGVYTFIKKKKTKKKQKKKETKKKQKKREKKIDKKKDKKKNKKKNAKIRLCLISYSIIFFYCWVHHWGFE